jgi:very-short-patch-repair endonuclease
MSYRGEVLVAIMNKPLDLAIAREKGWYRIPVSSQQKWLRDKWPAKWLAFYFTKKFGDKSNAIHYYAKVTAINKVPRYQLFPDEPRDHKSNRWYFQVFIGKLRPVPRPILSQRHRRITFIPTTKEKFSTARDVNDLYHGSSLEELLWDEFKRVSIPAEREEHIEVKKQHYFLDFAIYCNDGKIDVETDGDLWHHNPESSDYDNERDNLLKAAGWETLHFTSREIQEKMGSYCLPTVRDVIERFDGIDEGRIIPRKINLDDPETFQPSLFDDLE